MPTRRVWTGLDAVVLVYHIDSSGNRINLLGQPWNEADGPLLNYCYFQDINLNAQLPNQRRPVTGRPHKKITVLTEEYDMTVSHFYLGVKEIDPEVIFHRSKILELVLYLQAYDAPAEIEPHRLLFAKRESFSISGEENGVLTGNAKFIAEQLDLASI